MAGEDFTGLGLIGDPRGDVDWVASALLVVFNAVITVWPMVALNVTLAAINVFYIVRLACGRHDPQTFFLASCSPA